MKQRLFNVRYFDENGQEKHYLNVNVNHGTAVIWRDKFNELYRKPYSNGLGFYASAQVVEITS